MSFTTDMTLLSLLHNFIQQTLNLGSAQQIQILPAVYQIQDGEDL